MENIITSGQNPKVKQAIKLRKASKRKKEDLILIEGREEVIMALDSGIEVKTMFLCPDYSSNNHSLNTVEPNLIINVTKAIFNKLSMREKPDGWLALARPKYGELDDIKLGHSPLLVVTENLEKPGNLGAILRCADAAGANVVIVCEPQTDIYNPNVIRASRGAVFSLPTVVTNNQEAYTWLKKNNIRSLAATGQADKLYTEANLNLPTAIIIGTEHEGLSEFWLKRSEEKIKIPMQGKINSLNASVSTGILIYEVLRQRSNNQGTT